MRHDSERLGALASIGGLFLMAGMALIVLFEQSRPVIFSIYVFMVAIVPPLSAAVIYLAESGTVVRPAIPGAILVGVRALLLCSVITLITIVLMHGFVGPQSVASWFPAAVFVAAAALIAVQFRRRSLPPSEAAGFLDARLMVAVSVAVLVLSPLRPGEPMPIGLINYALKTPHFGLWLLLGIAWTAAGIWLRRHEGWAFPRKRKLLGMLAIAAVCLVILSLYDDSHFADFLHFQPLVGPALHAMHGGTPMVDTFSQYGFLPWYIYRAAYAVFEPAFGTAAVVARLTNLAYFAVIFSLLYFVTRRQLSALWFFVPALVLAIVTHITANGMLNMNALPMTLGGRYLLPAAMALLLVVKPGRMAWLALGLIALASLSSADILAFTLAPWGYCLLLDSVRSRSPHFFLRWLALALATIAVAQTAFIATIYFSTGAMVEYGPYFDIISQYRPNDAAELFWSLPLIPYYALWFPVGFAYFLVMAVASYRALRGLPPDSIVERLFPVAILGLGPLAYFFGRPDEATLTICCLSFAVVAIGVAEVMFINARRFGPVGPALASIMALAFSFTIADGFEHFMRPLDPASGNSTILRRCFTDEGCRLAEVPGNIGLALYTQSLDPRTKVGYYVRDAGPRIEETISMLRRLAPEARYVGLLVDSPPYRYADASATIGLTAVMVTNQWFAWSISSLVNDRLSTVLTGRILKKVAATPSGMLIVYPTRREEWFFLTKEILETLTAHCRLKPVETGKYYSAFLTEGCTG